MRRSVPGAFSLYPFSAQIPEVFACCRRGTLSESYASVLPNLTTDLENLRDESSAGRHHSDG